MAHSNRELQLRELRDDIKALKAELEGKNTELSASLVREEDLKKEITVLKEQVDYLTKKLFGRSSEKRKVEGQVELDIFNEVEVEASEEIEPEEETEIITYTRKKKARTARDEQIAGLPVKKKVIPLSEDEKTCDECGADMHFAGYKFIRRNLIFVPARMYVLETYAESYYCPECKKESANASSDRKNNIKTAKAPEALIPGSLASEPVVAHAIYQKYADAVPLYRQEKDWEQLGINLSRGRMASWITVCSERYLVYVYEYFHRLLLTREFLMADESRMQVLKEPDRKPETNSFIWLFRSGEDGLPPLILYHYSETRAGYNAEAFLKDWIGYLMTDGYAGYNKVPGIIRCCCWAHVRRMFCDAIPKGMEKDYSLPAVQGRMYCDKLFEIDRYCRRHNYTAEQRYEYRLKHAKPILEAFWNWVNRQLLAPSLDPKSRLGKALKYASNQKGFLENYLLDGRCSLSNNPSENAIRPFVVGRKNWLFCDTPKGAKASAILYTIVEMAKAYGLNVERYITFLLKNRPNEKWTDEELEHLAPWHSDVIEYCSHDDPDFDPDNYKDTLKDEDSKSADAVLSNAV